MARLLYIWGFYSLTILFVAFSTDGKKVLLLPAGSASHARQFYFIGERLAEEGHEVYMGMPNSFPQMDLFQGGKVNLLNHGTQRKDIYKMGLEAMSRIIEEMKTLDTISSFRMNHDIYLNLCTNPLSDEKYYRTLKDLKFDLAIVDTFPMSRCLLILPYSLDIPYMGLTTSNEPWLSRNPALPSVVPNNLLGLSYTDHMNFGERLRNLWQNIDWIAFTRVNFLSDANLKDYIRDKPMISLNEMAAKCMLFLIDVDPVLDYPRPFMPNEIHIGGLSAKPAKSLPADLKEFMDSASDGVIVMTFGSGTFKLNPELYNEFKTAFAQIKYKILWKYFVDEATDLSSNVKVMNWLPQNDILGHPNTKVFITHCGNNGQMEALYHGVPMIGYPIFGDQPHNCLRMAAHEYGICLKPSMFEADHLVKAVEQLLKNDSYRNNIQHASNIFKDSHLTPVERAVYWINHVMKFGGQHLRSHALDMPWYEYLMLDIAVFLLVVTFIIIISLVCFVKMIWKNYLRPHAKKD